MRVLAGMIPFVVCVACGQKVDTPAGPPVCDPDSMNCGYTPPAVGANGNGNEGGDSSTGQAFAKLSGQVLQFGDDYFDKGAVFNGTANVSAVGDNGARVTAPYDGTSFQLDGVLKTGANWFLVTPQTNGPLPTLTPVDTRAGGTLTVGLATASDVDGIFLNLGASRALERAQLVLHIVDSKDRTVVGVHAAITGIVAYRTAGAWVTEDNGTDDSGMIFLGNVDAGSALSMTAFTLSGTATGSFEVALQAGAVTVATAVVNPK